MALLTYSIAEEWLSGTIGKTNFAFKAFSGGGRGRIGAGAEHTLASYDTLAKEHEDGKTHVHGGPIPVGFYICQYRAHHKKFGACIFLLQTPTALIHVDLLGQIKLHNRDAFYVHGRGKHGSDGCIVPENRDDRNRLNVAVRDAKEPVFLSVVNEGIRALALEVKALFV